MSETVPATAPEPEHSPVAPEELAARLASKLCHDFISPAGAIVSGLDLLDDPAAKDMRDEAMDLIATSARKLVDQLSFARIAFGAASGVALFDCAEMERLTRGVYGHVRAELDWAVATPSLPKAPAQVLVNLAQLAANALPLGGLARLAAEVKTGLAGGPLGDGLGGRWVQAYYVYVLTAAAGGTIEAETGEELVTFRVAIPG